MSVLWMTSLRPIGKSTENDKIQDLFIKSVQNIEKPIKFSLTQFDDDNVEEYLIKNGELDINVKSPVLELTSKKFWSSVDARSKNLDFKAANCGKGEPMQGAPVWTGAPDVRLRNIRIGNRS